MRRELFDTTTCCTEVDIAGFADDPVGWFSQQMQHLQKMQTHTQVYLLAHADDGVIWGRLDQGELITSNDAAPQYSPPLRAETLQTARIFGPGGEMLIWRDEMGAWTNRLIAESMSAPSPDWEQAFEEQHILLGTKAEPQGQDFTLLSEGSQGLMHVIPFSVVEKIDEQHRPLRLIVRHYVKAEKSGFLRVDASRLHSLIQIKESNA
ncbi:MAG TPA: CRISPR-associated protein Csx19 [Ktedonobacteraceae bacterium]|nr:CRISPR-associated protein Csx19 [Ktedonobacteraceae bacterium]